MCFIISGYFNKSDGKPQKVIYLNHSKKERRKRKEGRKEEKRQQNTISQIYLKLNLKNTY